ncbi:hypothetical protein [Flavobacterium sp.]|uniref:hypothetical protein n=1 Tax=Flavobacterium sp. TaxID=239 RepID=UPI001219E1E6|nr:hypothetical protein [Flavobacterium sp.]RZJ70767.1 MAG: hypothetical protein EOO49_13010 [Flavobacterium sp.]
METQNRAQWTWWQKICFRFLFVYFTLYLLATPWLQFTGLTALNKLQTSVIDWFVHAFNDHFLHFRKELVPMNGSGDTSYAWTLLVLELFVALLASLVWSVLDFKKHSYYRLDYLLRTGLRYTISYFAISYGIIKIFLIQMLFPMLSQMATPLGEILPMRLSWLFIGYSDPYQFFSGALELTAGLLLLFRRTVTLGACLAFAIFLNVMMLNLCYDIPVKIFSMHLTAMCAYLLAIEMPRLYNFFIRHKVDLGNPLYHFASKRKSVKVGRIVLKCAFFLCTAAMLFDTFNYYQEATSPKKHFTYGLFKVERLIVNKDTVPVLANDTLVWKDIIFEKDEMASVGSRDTIFRPRYGRGYFYYRQDVKKQVLHAYKFNKNDSIPIGDLHYSWSGKDTLRLKTKVRNDSVFVLLKRDKRQFPLEKREFHWLSESNR